MALAKSGARTLLVDLDPQCNATSGLGVAPTERHPLVSTDPLAASLRPAKTDGLEVLPGSRNFHDVETLARAGRVAIRHPAAASC